MTISSEQVSVGTPGPWEQADPFGPDPNGMCVKAVSDDHLVASCTGYYGREGAIANARLIAAAPELLEALRVMVSALAPLHNAIMPIERELLSDDDVDRAQVAMPIALAAIAKATGEQA